MLVSEIRPIGKVGKNLLKNENANDIIDIIIEKPLQSACKKCKKKNIETVMSSANKKNITQNVLKKQDVIKSHKKNQNFLVAGKGFAWIMLNYNSLSDENREILFSLEEKFGEDVIWFVQSSYLDFVNSIRRLFRLKAKTWTFNDKYAEKFKEKQVKLVYNNKYPNRAVFIRMLIDEKTTVQDVELYFNKIIDKFKNQ